VPVNEIHAPVYIKGKVQTPAYPTGHNFRLYFTTGCSWSPGAEGDEENWRLMEGATDRGAVSGIVFKVFDLNRQFWPAGSHISQIELWHSIPDADNVLDHVNELPPADPVWVGAGVASAYTMWVFQTALKKKFRLTNFDANTASPQKSPFPSVPDADDGSFGWYFLKGTVPFANNDGIRLTTGVSFNTGYNKALARKYGRTISP
jgi:hypothetical protein